MLFFGSQSTWLPIAELCSLDILFLIIDNVFQKNFYLNSIRKINTSACIMIFRYLLVLTLLAMFTLSTIIMNNMSLQWLWRFRNCVLRHLHNYCDGGKMIHFRASAAATFSNVLFILTVVLSCVVVQGQIIPEPIVDTTNGQLIGKRGIYNGRPTQIVMHLFVSNYYCLRCEAIILVL